MSLTDDDPTSTRRRQRGRLRRRVDRQSRLDRRVHADGRRLVDPRTVVERRVVDRRGVHRRQGWDRRRAAAAGRFGAAERNFPPYPTSQVVRAAFAVVVLAGIITRLYTPSRLWLDEAISVSIARLPVTGIPTALRHDGAPPLYYLLLHGWIRLFGTSEVAVRSLSALFSVLALPGIWVLGRRLGGRRLAAAATVILATSPFAAFFGSEARMYSLVMLLVLLGGLAVLRTLEHPTWPRAGVVALCSGALLLSHYWTVFVLAMVGLWLAWSAVRSGSRRAPLLALAGLAGGAVLFAPWIPSFLFQIQHTGTPWIPPPSPVTGFQVLAQWSADAQSISFADSADPGIVVARLLELLLIALSALGVFGRALDVGRRVEVDLLGRPVGRELAVICFGAVTLGIAASIVLHSGFQPRYSAPMFVLLPLLAGLGVLALPDRLRLPTIAVVAVLGLLGASSTLTNRHKTQAGEIAEALRSQMQPDDVVVYCPDQLAPAISRLLPPGLRQVPYPGANDPSRVDWVDYGDRVEQADPATFRRTALAGTDNQAIWLVYDEGYGTVGAACSTLATQLAATRFQRDVVSTDSAYYEQAFLVRFAPVR